MKVTIVLNKEQIKKLKDDMNDCGSENTIKKEIQEIIDEKIFYMRS
ncbi:hypothetical protein LCGC14_2465210 [marine sediment metagenome]|uniref:Uncharacterized protein n=1 Tax=marine sediment metagenome TaxID=412755 RepID=A0A0F9E5Y1_9ZZZZ